MITGRALRTRRRRTCLPFATTNNMQFRLISKHISSQHAAAQVIALAEQMHHSRPNFYRLPVAAASQAVTPAAR